MKICPYCGAENRDEAAACYNCGQTLPDDPSPTQPLHTRNRPRTAPPQPPYSPGDTQPGSYPPASNNAPSYSTQPYPTAPSGAPPYASQYPPQPNPAPASSTQPYAPQSYPAQPGNPQSPYGPQYPPYYPPPPPAPAPPPDQPSRIWPILAAGLGLLLLCACVFAFYTMTSATGSGIARLKGQVATQVAGIVPGSADNPAPAEPAPIDTPTLWPTFTPAPSDTPAPAPTETANPTQAAITDKILSVECRDSIDQLGKVSNEVTSNPLKVLEEGWRQSLDQAMGDMKTHCGSPEAASPVPGEVSAVQHSLTQATTEYDTAKALWTEAINQRDPSKAVEAAGHIGSAAKYLGQAAADLKKIGQ